LLSKGQLKQIFPSGSGRNKFELKPREKKWKEEINMIFLGGRINVIDLLSLDHNLTSELVS